MARRMELFQSKLECLDKAQHPRLSKYSTSARPLRPCTRPSLPSCVALERARIQLLGCCQARRVPSIFCCSIKFRKPCVSVIVVILSLVPADVKTMHRPRVPLIRTKHATSASAEDESPEPSSHVSKLLLLKTRLGGEAL